VLQDACFQLFFDGVGEFHSGVRNSFTTVVLKGIVGRGDDHAGLKIILPHQNKATPGVVITPAKATVAPVRARPAASNEAMCGPDSRVSIPMRT